MEIHHRSPDMGEDYWSAIEAPHKHYEYPWHFDQTFKHAVDTLHDSRGSIDELRVVQA